MEYRDAVPVPAGKAETVAAVEDAARRAVARADRRHRGKGLECVLVKETALVLAGNVAVVGQAVAATAGTAAGTSNTQSPLEIRGGR